MAAAGDDPRPLPADARRQGARRRDDQGARRGGREVHPLPGRRAGLQGLPRLPGLDLRLAELDGRPRHPGPLRAASAATCSRSTSASIKDGWVADAAMTVPIGPVDAAGPRAARRHPGRRSSPGSSRCDPATTSATSRRRSSARSRSRASRSSAPWSVTGSAARCTRTRRCPNFGEPGKGPLLEEGTVLAIEPMVNAGGRAGADGRRRLGGLLRGRLLAAHFEFTSRSPPTGRASSLPGTRRSSRPEVTGGGVCWCVRKGRRN